MRSFKQTSVIGVPGVGSRDAFGAHQVSTVSQSWRSHAGEQFVEPRLRLEVVPARLFVRAAGARCELAALRGRLNALVGDLEVRTIHDSSPETFRSLLDASKALDVLDRAERRTLATWVR